MLTVTDGAKKHLKKLLLAHSVAPDFGVRLVGEKSGGLGIVLDRAKPNDYVVEHEGSKVLLVEPKLEKWLTGATVDTEDTPEGEKLRISKE